MANFILGGSLGLALGVWMGLSYALRERDCLKDQLRIVKAKENSVYWPDPFKK